MTHVKIATLTALILLLSACASTSTIKLPSLDLKKDNAPTVTLNARGVPSHHKVKKGETISSIAMRYRLNWREVAKLNGLTAPYTIHTGQWVVLWKDNNSSQLEAKKSAVETPKPTVTTAVAKSATVQPTQTQKPPVVQAKPAVTTPSTFISSAGLVYPVPKESVIVRHFGVSNDSDIKSEGVWFRGEENSPVRAVADGRVIFIDESSAHGIFINVRHNDGLISEYRFVKQLNVEPNQVVKAGQQIASTRKTSSGAVITEFRLSKNGVYIDPMTMLR